jgi:hypothetical protein
MFNRSNRAGCVGLRASSGGLFAAAIALCAGSAVAQPLSTTISYQGELSESGGVSNGVHDFKFFLYDAPTGGSVIGLSQCRNNLDVVSGRFSTDLDFGAVFGTQQLWLEIWVRADTGLGCVNNSGFVALERRPLTAAPFANRAQRATTADTAALATTATSADNAANLDGQAASFYLARSSHTGTLPAAALSGNYSGAVNFTNTSNTFSGSGASLINLNATNIASGLLADARLSNNIPRLGIITVGVSQVWTGINEFQGVTLFGGPTGLPNNAQVRIASPSGAPRDGLYIEAGTDETGLYINQNSLIGDQTAMEIFMTSGGTAIDVSVAGNSGVTRAFDGTVGGTNAIGVLGRNASPSGLFPSTGVMGESVSAVGVGVMGTSPAYGVYGRATAASGTGVAGVHELTTGDGVGVTGTSAAANGTGVRGIATSSTGINTGVLGSAASATGVGVRGIAALGTGMAGQADGANGIGVSGVSTAASGTGIGLAGATNSPTGFGVRGTNLASTGTPYGMQGTVAAATGVGVGGVHESLTGAGYGVEGKTNSSNASAAGVLGVANVLSGTGTGVRGTTFSTQGSGVHGSATSATGINFGVLGTTSSSTGFGVRGEGNNSSGGVGVSGQSAGIGGVGVSGVNTAATGIGAGVSGVAASPDGFGAQFQNLATTGAGVGLLSRTSSSAGVAIKAQSTAATGSPIALLAERSSADGYTLYTSGAKSYIEAPLGVNVLSPTFPLEVEGSQIRTVSITTTNATNNAVGILSTAAATGAISSVGGRFESAGDVGRGVVGVATAASADTNIGGFFTAAGNTARAVSANATDENNANAVNYGVYAQTQSSNANAYGVFTPQNLGAGGVKTFRIDHPQAPTDKYLMHYSAEGPEVLNIYSGSVMLDAAGSAVVELPSYFTLVNKDPRYLLTPVGAPMPMLHVATEVDAEAFDTGAAATFVIGGGAPNAKVCWEVKAIRWDRWTRQRGTPVEVEKVGADKGTLQNPELFTETPQN